MLLRALTYCTVERLWVIYDVACIMVLEVVCGTPPEAGIAIDQTRDFGVVYALDRLKYSAHAWPALSLLRWARTYGA